MTPMQKAAEAIRECRRYGRSSEDCLTAALSALEAEGWKLMPRVLTKEMIEAQDFCSPNRAQRIHAAMYASAPKPE